MLPKSLYVEDVKEEDLKKIKKLGTEYGLTIHEREWMSLVSLSVIDKSRYVCVEVNDSGFFLNTTATFVKGLDADEYLKEFTLRKEFVDKANHILGLE